MGVGLSKRYDEEQAVVGHLVEFILVLLTQHTHTQLFHACACFLSMAWRFRKLWRSWGILRQTSGWMRSRINKMEVPSRSACVPWLCSRLISIWSWISLLNLCMNLPLCHSNQFAVVLEWRPLEHVMIANCLELKDEANSPRCSRMRVSLVLNIFFLCVLKSQEFNVTFMCTISTGCITLTLCRLYCECCQWGVLPMTMARSGIGTTNMSRLENVHSMHGLFNWLNRCLECCTNTCAQFA